MDKISPKETQKQKMFKLLELCYKSGLSNKEWCMQNQLSVQTFYYWQSIYRKEKQPNADFLPITTGQKAISGIRINYPNGVQLELEGETAPSIIASLINLA